MYATYCPACGGTGWLPSLPEGQSDCPPCSGTGKVPENIPGKVLTLPR